MNQATKLNFEEIISTIVMHVLTRAYTLKAAMKGSSVVYMGDGGAVWGGGVEAN